MKIAIDIDSIINSRLDNIEFISVLSNLLIADNQIFVLADRKPGSEQDVAEELDHFQIEYNQIVITPQKSDYVKNNQITAYLVNDSCLWIGA